jgi:hypothetical protein
VAAEPVKASEPIAKPVAVERAEVADAPGSNKRRKRGRNQRVNGSDQQNVNPSGSKSYSGRRG